MTAQIGPEVRIKLSCFRCQWEDGEPYQVQSDSGVDYYCHHPSFKEKKYIGGNTDNPKWCPLRLTILRETLLKELEKVDIEINTHSGIPPCHV